MNDTYRVILPNGRRFDGVSLEEAKRLLLDEAHYSYFYVDDLVRKATRPIKPPLEIEWVEEGKKNWIVDGVRMNRKCALCALEFRGCDKQQRETILRCVQLCATVRQTAERIQQCITRIDEATAHLAFRKKSPGRALIPRD